MKVPPPPKVRHKLPTSFIAADCVANVAAKTLAPFVRAKQVPTAVAFGVNELEPKWSE